MLQNGSILLNATTELVFAMYIKQTIVDFNVILTFLVKKVKLKVTSNHQLNVTKNKAEYLFFDFE